MHGFVIHYYDSVRIATEGDSEGKVCVSKYICSATYTVCTLPYMYKNTRWCLINTYNISLQKLFSHIIYTIISDECFVMLGDFNARGVQRCR